MVLLDHFANKSNTFSLSLSLSRSPISSLGLHFLLPRLPGYHNQWYPGGDYSLWNFQLMKWRLCKLVKTHRVEVSGGGELLTVWKLPRIIHRRLKTLPIAMIILKADMKYVTSSKIWESITDLGGVNLPFRGCFYFSYAATNIQTPNLLCIWHQLYQETMLSSSEPPNWRIS